MDKQNTDLYFLFLRVQNGLKKSFFHSQFNESDTYFKSKEVLRNEHYLNRKITFVFVLV